MLPRRDFIRRAAGAAALLGMPFQRAEQILCTQSVPLPPVDLLSSDPMRYWAGLRAQWLLAPDHINLNCGSVGCSPLPVLRAMIDHIIPGSVTRKITACMDCVTLWRPIFM